MKPEDRRVLENHILGQLTNVERELARLEAERTTLKQLLIRARRENASLREVTRKNSYDRILIESRVVETLKSTKRPVSTRRLYFSARQINPDLSNATFRSHLHRLKGREQIVSVKHGQWTTPENAKRMEMEGEIEPAS